MPFQSKKQMKKFYAMEARGEMPKGTAKTWAHETSNIKDLPQYAHGRKIQEKASRKRGK